MSHIDALKTRNQNFAASFTQRDLVPLPKLGMIIVACIDARVDPTTIFDLELGEAVIMRNNGGRVTAALIEEITALSFLVGRITGQDAPGFHIMLMQHTKCGAQQFAAPDFQADIKARTGIDVTPSAITYPEQDLLTDIARLRDEPNLHGGLTVSAMLYDVETGLAHEIASTQSLEVLRKKAADL
ncbi:carbonic anhydrase [Sneathiella glossodoripedis]|uniref:carbonic anhydrase n=1 Tax=Sneathiella glossodoripedis TaxID=418853 RepID=UPI000470BD61|nr:carbonic anhydrase [Sneathiella glossodoripedis]